jgi:uncharacterized protein
VNGTEVPSTYEDGYAVINREWKKGDKVEYNMPMKINRVTANEKVEADRGLVALERGPILYCIEDKDNAFDVNNIMLPDNADVKFTLNKDVFKGTFTIQGEGLVLSPKADKLGFDVVKKIFTAIPYNVWDNRGGAKMRVWLPRTVSEFKLSSE